MKKIIYVLIFSLVVISGLVYSYAPFANGSDANLENKNETSKKPIPKLLSAAERKASLKKWEATPAGIKFKEWEASPAGKKVYASESKINNYIRDYANMEAIVTALALPSGSRLGFGVMVKINDDDYILSFGLESKKEFEQLQSLKVNDKIMIRSHFVSHAPKYAYPIIAGDYVERDGKIIYKRAPRKDGC